MHLSIKPFDLVDYILLATVDKYNLITILMKCMLPLMDGFECFIHAYLAYSTFSELLN